MDRKTEAMDVARWVDERLTVLNSAADWRPDIDRAFECLQVADATRHDRSQNRLWMATAILAVGGVIVLVLPWQLLRNNLLDSVLKVEQLAGYELRLPVPPAKAPEAVVQTEKEVVTAPRIIRRVEPVYPESERAARTQGRVILAVDIHKDGSVLVTGVVQSLTPAFDQAAEDALEQWKFEPATRNGEPVNVSLNVEVNFNLR